MYFQVRDFVLGCNECHPSRAEKAEVRYELFVWLFFGMIIFYIVFDIHRSSALPFSVPLVRKLGEHVKDCEIT